MIMYRTIPTDNHINLYCAYRTSRQLKNEPIPTIYMSSPGNTTPTKTNSCLSYAKSSCTLESLCNNSRYRVAQCDYRIGNGNVILVLRIENPIESDYGEWRCLVNGDSTVNAQVKLVEPGERLFISNRMILFQL